MAWLGTAYHEVLEIAGTYDGNDFEKAVTTAWEEAISREYHKVKLHPLDKRFGPPETWPSYHLVAAMARLRAKEVAAARQYLKGDVRGPADDSTTVHREVRLSGVGGKIVGRPDVVLADEIIDYKSGTVYDEEDKEQVKPSYLRQLRLYAFLANEALGRWPRRGVLVPMIGLPVEAEIDNRVCKEEVNYAVRLLDEYNSLVFQRADCNHFATASPKACRWCPFQVLCPAFWDAVTARWSDELRTTVITGTVRNAPQAIHCGAALSITIDVKSGTEATDTDFELSPVNPAIHSVANNLMKGDEIRVTGLLRRPDGTVHMAHRTVIFVLQDLPAIVVGGDTRKNNLTE